MKPDDAALVKAAADAAPVSRRLRWWGGYIEEGSPPRRRWVIRWGRLGAVFGILCVAGYLGLATALWAYYTSYRKIPEVKWIDIAVLPRFSRVQSAIGAHYMVQAKELWAARNYAQAIVIAQAAVNKSPANLEARLFLASCWQQAGRIDDALRVLRNGLAQHAAELPLQTAAVELCLTNGRFEEVLQLLRDEFPKHGARPLDGTNWAFQLAETRSVLELSGAIEAEKILRSHAGLADQPVAAPLLARMDWEQGRHEAAFQRLTEAVDRQTADLGTFDAYVETALRLGRTTLARQAASQCLKLFPGVVPAQLRYLEAHGTRKGDDRLPWMTEMLRFLIQHRNNPVALQQLGNLAASQGWSDLAYLLYENSLNGTLRGFPFAVFYIVSLVKSGELAGADAAWRDLSAKHASQLAAYSHIGAMVSWGAGREVEALQAVAQLRKETAGEPRRRQMLAELFKAFRYSRLSEEMERLEKVPLP
ncbi:MAG: tetratricopeptide repeat protein [Opitutaceae bacterium]